MQMLHLVVKDYITNKVIIFIHILIVHNIKQFRQQALDKPTSFKLNKSNNKIRYLDVTWIQPEILGS